MTNIGALKVREDDKEYLVFVADGMGSVDRVVLSQEGVRINPNGGTKNDNHQKLFQIRDYLLMGTGRGDLIQAAAIEVSKLEISSAKELADKILEVTANYSLTKDDALNFIVGGKDEGSLSIYQVNTTGNYRAIDGTADYKKRGIEKRDAAFDGSGATHVRDYLKGCGAAGKPLVAKDLADALVLAYEFGKTGANDTGVNDKLQYGVVSDNGVSTLYHPDVMLLTQEGFQQYLGEMCGVDMSLPAQDAGEEEVNQLYAKRNDLARVLRNLYLALDLDLKDNSEARKQYTAVAESFANDEVDLENLLGAKVERTDTKSNVAKGATALVQKGLRALLDYKQDYDKRQSEIEQRALSYVK